MLLGIGVRRARVRVAQVPQIFCRGFVLRIIDGLSANSPRPAQNPLGGRGECESWANGHMLPRRFHAGQSPLTHW